MIGPRAAVRPRLVLGLGNPLMGDDGIGWHVVERLRRRTDLPPDLDLAWGGTDLLGCASLLEGRRQIVLLDAATGLPPAAVVPLDPTQDDLDDRSLGAHSLSLVGALRLLELLVPGFAAGDVLLLGIGVAEVRAGDGLSRELEGRLAGIVAEVLELAADAQPATV